MDAVAKDRLITSVIPDARFKLKRGYEVVVAGDPKGTYRMVVVGLGYDTLEKVDLTSWLVIDTDKLGGGTTNALSDPYGYTEEINPGLPVYDGPNMEKYFNIALALSARLQPNAGD